MKKKDVRRGEGWKDKGKEGGGGGRRLGGRRGEWEGWRRKNVEWRGRRRRGGSWMGEEEERKRAGKGVVDRCRSGGRVIKCLLGGGDWERRADIRYFYLRSSAGGT